MVSIIIPYYNTEKYIRQCLESVAKQTYTDWEALCISDGSNDGSDEIVSEYVRTDYRFKQFIREKTNAGEARNYGINQSKGEYLCFLDSDDYIEPDMLERMMNQMISNDSDICLCDADRYSERDARYIYENNRYLGLKYMLGIDAFSTESVMDRIYQITTVVPWAKIFKRSSVERNNIHFMSVARNNDVYFVCMMLALSTRISVIKNVLIHHRIDIENNLQSGYHLSPTLPLYVFSCLRKELKAKKLYEKVESNYLLLFIGQLCGTYVKLAEHSDGLAEFIKCANKMMREEGIYDDILKVYPCGCFTTNKEMFPILRSICFLYEKGFVNEPNKIPFSAYLEEMREEYRRILGEVHLEDSSLTIGIYGKGKHTTGLINLYRKLYGDIKAQIIYVVSEKSALPDDSTICYRELSDEVDFIIVSSYIYNDEMLGNLNGYIDKEGIISFYPPYNTDLFSLFSDDDQVRMFDM